MGTTATAAAIPAAAPLVSQGQPPVLPPHAPALPASAPLLASPLSSLTLLPARRAMPLPAPHSADLLFFDHKQQRQYTDDRVQHREEEITREREEVVEAGAKETCS